MLDTTKTHLSSCFNNLMKLLPWELWHGSLLQHRCYFLLCPLAVSFVNFKSIMISFSSSSAFLFTDFDQIAILDWDKRGHNFASIISLGYSSTRPLRNWLLSRDALSTFTLCSNLWSSVSKEEILYNLVNMVLSNIKLSSVETWWSWRGAVMALIPWSNRSWTDQVQSSRFWFPEAATPEQTRYRVLGSDSLEQPLLNMVWFPVCFYFTSQVRCKVVIWSDCWVLFCFSVCLC
jgi:hypothetical protein